MKEINARRSEFIKVEIDEREEKEITISYLRNKFKLPYGYHWFTIWNGELIGTKDFGGSGYEEDTTIRVATESDILVVGVISSLGW